MTDLQWGFIIMSALAIFGWWYAATQTADKIQAQESMRYYRTQRDSLLKTVQIQSRTITDLKRRRAEPLVASGTAERAG